MVRHSAAVGRQARLKAGWHQRHGCREQREEPERGGEDVEVAGHTREGAAMRGLLRFYLEEQHAHLSLHIRCLEPAPCSVANVQHFNRLSSFKNAIDRAINTVRPAAVEDMPKLACLVCSRPDIWMTFEIEDRPFESVVPPLSRGGVFGVDFFIDSSEVTFGPGCNVNEIGHVRTRIR